jgi:hypothetical protein
VEQLWLDIDEQATRRGKGVKRLPVSIGLAALLAAASLVAVNAQGGKPPNPRIMQPKASSNCTTPPNGFLWSKTVDDTTFQVCISQEGNINQIWYPRPAAYLQAITFDGYCLKDGTSNKVYSDFSLGSGTSVEGFGPATLTVGPSSKNYNPIIMTRSTLDGRYELSEYIKINFQPRSIFVGMTVKNIDTTHHSVQGLRFVRPVEPGGLTQPDEYNEYGPGPVFGRTGQARQSGATAGSNSLLFGPTQASGMVLTQQYADFQGSSGSGRRCSYQPYEVGLVTGGNRVFVGGLFPGANPALQLLQLAPGESGSIGNFVYRMV